VLEKPSVLANDDIFSPKIQLRAEMRIIPGGEKRFQLEAAEDLGVLVGPANARCQVLIFHRIGDDDEMSGEAASKFFRRPESTVGQRTCKISKRGPVDGMNDDWNSCASSGQSPKQSSFAAMRMHYLRRF